MRRRRPWDAPGIAEPQAIDPASGFKVPLDNLTRQWDGEMVDYRFVDKRNPGDYQRGVKDKMALPYSRPEPADQFVAGNLIWEDGRYVTTEQGGAVLTEGIKPEATL